MGPHPGGGISSHVPDEQIPTQSVWTLQSFPASHGVQLPPQSTSVSSMFCSLSEHVDGATQVPAMHVSEAQSDATEHALPAAHPEQSPPQSTSVSFPFLVRSSQEAATATHVPLSQAPEAHSSLVVQD